MTDGKTADATVEFGILIYPGAQQSAVLGLTDLFVIAGRLMGARGAGVRVTHWRVRGGVPVRVDGPDAVGADAGGPDSGGPDMAIPAVMILPPSMEEPISPDAAAPLAAWLREQHGRGTVLASVCAGAFLLGETGLLGGRAVTTHWSYLDRFRQRFPEARVQGDRLLIDGGDIITAGGLMSWTDLGLKLLDRFLGPAVMLDTARFLLIDPPGRAQSWYSGFSPRLTHGDAAVLKVQHWLQANTLREITVTALANVAGLEPRTFLRRFRKATGLTSTDYCQRLRVARAQDLLQSGNMPVDSIAWQVGYGDPGAFRKVFARITGLTPGEYRQRFRSGAA